MRTQLTLFIDHPPQDSYEIAEIVSQSARPDWSIIARIDVGMVNGKQQPLSQEDIDELDGQTG